MEGGRTVEGKGGVERGWEEGRGDGRRTEGKRGGQRGREEDSEKGGGGGR